MADTSVSTPAAPSTASAPAPSPAPAAAGGEAAPPSSLASRVSMLARRDDMSSDWDDAEGAAPETPAAPPDETPRDWDDDGSTAESAATPLAATPAALPAALLDRAASLGIDPAELAVYGSAAGITHALDAFESRLAGWGRQVMQQRQPAPGPGTPPPAPAQAPAPIGGPPAATPLAERFAQMRRDNYDPGVVEALSQIDQHYAGQLGRLEAQFAGWQQAHQQREQQAYLDDFDGWIGSLEPTYHETLGTEPVRRLPAASPKLEARRQLLEQVAALEIGYRQAGLQLPERREVFARALRMVHGAKAQAAARDEVRAAVEKRQKQATTPPTHRQGQPGTPEEGAQQFVRRFMKERQISP